MTHENISLNTKLTLVASLKKFMDQKPLSKITVSELCSDCGLNRKTFYYHFQDIYDLVRWMLEQEAVEIVKKSDLLRDYEEIIRFVVDYVDKNNHILNCAYDAMGREGMKRFFFSDFNGIIEFLIHCVEEKQGFLVDEDFKRFLCNFYTNALAGMLIDWFHDRTFYDREKLIDYIVLTIKVSIPDVISKWQSLQGQSFSFSGIPFDMPQQTKSEQSES